MNTRCVPPGIHGGILNPIALKVSVYVPTLQLVLCYAKRGHVVQPGALKHIETRNAHAAAYAKGEFRQWCSRCHGSVNCGRLSPHVLRTIKPEGQSIYLF